MNIYLQEFARSRLKERLQLCDIRQQDLFRRMYSNDMDLPLNTIIDVMPESKLDWAMKQVENTLLENSRKRVS